jgi:3-methyladenine DNA glycosylase/8-oxoguanine DNA glycosylase
MADEIIECALIGRGGEPVDLRRTLNGHGVTSLAPFRVNDDASELQATLSLPSQPPRRVTLRAGRPGTADIVVHGSPPDERERAAILAAVRWILRLDEDLGPFYTIARDDPDLAWVTAGAGRMTRCQTVFEEVVKTICTTNCTWSATIRMVDALVLNLGEPTPDAPGEGVEGRVFPTSEAMAAADEAFYRERMRCGYRGAYLQRVARAVAGGELDLEPLGRLTADELPDEELAKRLLALPGVGPYAASHIMMMLGRYSRPIFDSWTRPSYAALVGQENLTDREIAARFASYGRFAGLAFWMTVTKPWHGIAEGETIAIERTKQ